MEEIIKKGIISTTDNFSFRTKAECASLFGRNYGSIFKGGVHHPKERDSQLIFWQEGENERWENSFVIDKKGEIIEFTERKKTKNLDWIQERIKIAKTQILNNLIFYKEKGKEYKFKGVFTVNIEKTLSSSLIIYERVSTKAKTYPPENNKPIKDLLGLVSEGRLKVNEEVYMIYRDIEYTGRITPKGKIKITEGEFSVSKSALMIMKKTPGCEMNFERANGYSWWRNWKGVPIGDLRKI